MPTSDIDSTIYDISFAEKNQRNLKINNEVVSPSGGYPLSFNRSISKLSPKSTLSSSYTRSYPYYEYYGQRNYTQPLLYGIPPHNLLLAEFLLRGHFSHAFMNPLFSSIISAQWIGPNKHYNWNRGPLVSSTWDSIW